MWAGTERLSNPTHGSRDGVNDAPAVGAILMSVSTIVVAINAQLLRRLDLRPDRPSAQPA